MLRAHFLKFSKLFLIATSIIFYAYSSLESTLLLISSISMNFFISRVLHLKEKQKIVLTLGILFNLTLLSYYKYSNFFLESSNALFNTDFSYLYITLPLAISFFTFQQIAFLMDSYHRNVNEKSFLNYFLFVSFFPQLIIGPIVKHSELMPQFSVKKNLQIDTSNITRGLTLIAIGLFKKVVLADTLAIWANHGYAHVATITTPEAWLSILAFTFQIYFDFSGYTDIALGIALLFNIVLPINFNSPYKAKNIQDAWQSWHITLTRFFVTYLYFPLVKRYKSLRYLILTFIFAISGLWHGADWTFVLWGLSFAVIMLIYQLWKKYGFILPSFIAWMLTFSFITLSTVLFRAQNFFEAKIMFVHLFTSQKALGIHYNYPYDLKTVSIFLLSILIIFFTPNAVEYTKKLKLTLASGITVTALFIISIISVGEGHEFIYFNF